jgi:hypothetical protein
MLIDEFMPVDDVADVRTSVPSGSRATATRVRGSPFWIPTWSD